jgi:hypothetical protein
MIEVECWTVPASVLFDPLTQPRGRARVVLNSVDQNSDGSRKAVDHRERGDTFP